MIKFSSVFILLFILACSTSDGLGDLTAGGEITVVEEGDAIFIVDKTGKRWNVTYAVENYGFDPYSFQFGLGPQAIKPLNTPDFISPGEPGYPGSSESFLVIGTTIGGQIKAYPINTLIRYEIVNELFSDESSPPVIAAVGY